MPKYKLIYFNAKGFAETARILFAQAGVEYEDFRLDREKWPQLKLEMPFRQVPVLEVDGVQIADSSAIARYLAREFGMAGKNRVEEAHVDMFAGACHDLMKPLLEIFHTEAGSKKKDELKKKYNEETVPKFLTKFESTLAASSSGYLVGGGLTWADIVFMIFMSWVEVEAAEVLSAYPKVKEHGKKVAGLPKIAEWIAKRPKTDT